MSAEFTLLLTAIIFVENVISIGNIGMNVGSGNYYSADMPYLNRFYTAQSFIKENTTIKFDSNGYPLQLLENQTVGALFMSIHFDDNGLWPVPKSMQGLHIFSFNGNCTNRCSFRWNAMVINDSYAPNKWLMNVSQPLNDPHANKCGVYIKGPMSVMSFASFYLVPTNNILMYCLIC